MKNKEKYYAVNNQEDEDGYTLYPENTIIYENIKGKQDIDSRNNTANTGSSFLKPLFHETSAKTNRITKR